MLATLYQNDVLRRRKDLWPEEYMGTAEGAGAAGSAGEGIEVLTRAVQMLTFGVYGKDVYIRTLLDEDPETLDLLLGFWLRFDPEGT